MGLTQKYKQQQQQVRVQTNEELYNAGMYFSDTPLTNGQSRVMLNYDIDSLTGKLTPRRGLQSLGCITPDAEAKEQLTNAVGENIVLASKICTQTDPKDPRGTVQKLQSVLYNTETTGLQIATAEAESTNTQFSSPRVAYTELDATGYYTAGAGSPYILKNPGVYKKACITKTYFTTPAGTFAFGNSYYTFMQEKNTPQKLLKLPYKGFNNFKELLQHNAPQELDTLGILPNDIVQNATVSGEDLEEYYIRSYAIPKKDFRIYSGKDIWRDSLGNVYYSTKEQGTWVYIPVINSWQKQTQSYNPMDGTGTLTEMPPFNGRDVWASPSGKAYLKDRDSAAAYYKSGTDSWGPYLYQSRSFTNTKWRGQDVFNYQGDSYILTDKIYKQNADWAMQFTAEATTSRYFIGGLYVWHDNAGNLYHSMGGDYKLVSTTGGVWTWEITHVWDDLSKTTNPTDVWYLDDTAYYSDSAGQNYKLNNAQYPTWEATTFPTAWGVLEETPKFQGAGVWFDGIDYHMYDKFTLTRFVKTMIREDSPEGILIITDATALALASKVAKTYPVSGYALSYTRTGKDIKADPEITLLNPKLPKFILKDEVYYPCKVIPQKLNPTEAASWGYNMLLDNPYDFVCESVPYNVFTITGIIPYDNTGMPVLTPRKNEEVTLKCYWRGPNAYHSDTENARTYATTKQLIEVTDQIEQYATRVESGITYYRQIGTSTYDVRSGYIIAAESAYLGYYIVVEGVQQPVSEENLVKKFVDVTNKRDPETAEEILESTDLKQCKIGDWWYTTVDAKYYMVIPGEDLAPAHYQLQEYTEKPAASIVLGPSGSAVTDEDPVRVIWEMRSQGAAGWTELSNQTVKISEHGIAPFILTTTLPDSEVIVRCTIYDDQDVAEDESLVLTTNTIGLSLVTDDIANNLNLHAANFELGKCTGMCEWEKRLVLWGIPEALDTLFISDVNNPGFFPYPNNIDTFVDPIMTVHNYGDELLVLTTTALYRLIWDVDGLGWTHKLVQQNLHVTEADIPFTKVIKNMFFFKSGDYFYMMVPKVTSASSVRGEVTIAPISKPIEKLLDNFHEEVYNLIKVMVDKDNLQDFTDKLVNYFVYNDSSKIVVNYVYSLDEVGYRPPYLYVQLIYDTELRAWTMKAFEAPQMLYASHQDAIQQDRFLSLTDKDGADQVVIQYYKFGGDADNKGKQDTAVKKYNEDGIPVYSEKLIKNYQYLDTGNREINTELKKRFREFQIKIKNKSLNSLSFYNAFLIDGSLRKDLQHYNPVAISDPATGEVVIVVEKVLDDNFEHMMFTPMYKTTRIERVLVPQRMLQDDGELMPTTLAEENTDADAWVLNQSAFPGRSLYKIRMPISGKGYAPRAIILSTNETDYDILGHTWVYRTMNGR